MTFSRPSVAPPWPPSASQPRRLSLLGSTGAIGCSTLDLDERKRDAFEVEVLTANRSVARLAMQAKRFGPRLAVVAEETDYTSPQEGLQGSGLTEYAGAAASPPDTSRETRKEKGWQGGT